MKQTGEPETDFDRFRKAYPSRSGDRAWNPARVLFDKAVKAGTAANIIIDAAKRYAVEEAHNSGTPFIMQAQRWLRNKRWVDYPPPETTPGQPPSPSLIFIREDTEQWKAWQRVKKTPCKNWGWWFPSEWPPT